LVKYYVNENYLESNKLNIMNLNQI